MSLRRLAIALLACFFLAGFDAQQDRSPANVVAFGAVGDGKRDDTSAIRKAANTGRSVYIPAGSYVVTDVVELKSGQMAFGDGRTQSVLLVDTRFNSTAPGVVRLGSKEPGATLRDVGIVMVQPNSARREDMIRYPAAIVAKSAARFKIEGVRVSGAWIGLDATGNTGGAYISDFESGAISAGMVFDHPLDFIRINSFHCWPFGFSSKEQLAAWSDGNTIAAKLENVDGLNVTGWNTLRARTIVAGSTFGTMTAVNLDGNFSRIEMQGKGRLLITSLWKSSAAENDFLLHLTGGSLTVSSFHVVGGTRNGPMVAVDGPAATLTMGDGLLENGPTSHPTFLLKQGEMSVNNVRFKYGTNVQRGAPFIKQISGRISISGSQWTARGTGSGAAIEISTDDWHTVTNNSFVDWPVIYPEDMRFGSYSGNAPASANRNPQSLGRN